MGKKARKKSVTKSELINKVYHRINGENPKKSVISKLLIQDVYQVIMEYMEEKLMNFEFIWIPGFGSFFPEIVKRTDGVKRVFNFAVDNNLYKFLKSYFKKEKEIYDRTSI